MKKRIGVLGILALLVMVAFVGCGEPSGPELQSNQTNPSNNQGNQGDQGNQGTQGDGVILTPITSVNIYITAPVTGVIPSTNANTIDVGYTITAVTWSPNDDRFIIENVYTASLTLTADSGYSFSNLNSATINGQAALISDKTNTTAIVSLTFPATKKPATNITIKDQPILLSYNHGEPLNLTGLSVTLLYDDFTLEDVSVASFFEYNITTYPSHGTNLIRSAYNMQPVTITYGDLAPIITNNLTVHPRVTTLTVDEIEAKTFTGSPHTPGVTVRDGEIILTNTDYSVSYSNNTNAGTATVTITGIGNYAGSSGSGSFTINKAAGAVVNTPTIASVTSSSIILNAISAGNGQTVQYVFSRTNTLPSESEWQNSPMYDISSGGGVFYIFARTEENINHTTGAVSDSLQLSIVTTTDEWTTSLVNIMNGGNGTESSPKKYTIYLLEDITVTGSTGTTATFGYCQYIEVTIIGDKTISLDEISHGSLFYIRNRQTLILQDVDLKGYNQTVYPYPVVYIFPWPNGAVFIMKGNATVSGGSTGVYSGEGGTFIMQDNTEVSDNFSGGVSGNRPTFIMQGYSSVSRNGGRGVSVAGGIFTMQDYASVHSNEVTNNRDNGEIFGSGVYIRDGGIFTMQGNASVHSNKAINTLASTNRCYGIGVYVEEDGTFSMQNYASVYNNSSENVAFGSGVYIKSGDFTMLDYTSVYGNTALFNRGGVCVGVEGFFTMKDGASVYGNTAAFSIGTPPSCGVYISGIFIMHGGTVFGSNELGIAANGFPLANGTADGNSMTIFVNVLTSGVAKYGDGTYILPHTDWFDDKTAYTIVGRE